MAGMRVAQIGVGPEQFRLPSGSPANRQNMLIALLPLAAAHRPGLSYAQTDGQTLELTFARPELEGIAPLSDLNAARILLAEATVHTVQLTVDGQACHYGDSTVQAVEGDGIQLSTPLECPSGTNWHYDAGFLTKMETGHRHYLEAFGQPIAVLDPQHKEADFTGQTSTSDVSIQFLKLGIEHIWTGYDHLMFLFGLLIAARRLPDMLLVVTGFTLAHSITLSLAATGQLSLPPSIVEPAIAATIVLVGIENFFHPPARRRIIITFFLGLIHGFGFAGALAELGLPQHALVLALLCFNGGVEIGQATVVLVLLPLLLALHRLKSWPTLEKIGSTLVILAGIYWMADRLL